MYKGGGYVGGAVFNDDFSVRQYISNDKADLPRLRSSKYLQSRLDGFYVQVRDLLKKGEKVLVCGSPCQMAALRAFCSTAVLTSAACTACGPTTISTGLSFSGNSASGKRRYQ
jgi:coenzyme F420-reducing hydrogenase beta subunit